MRQHVGTSGRQVALLLVPALLLAGALQPDPVLPGPQPQVRVEAATPAPAALAPRPASPADVATVLAPVSQRIAAVEPRRAAVRAGRERGATTAPPAASPVEQRGTRALLSLRYDWQALGYRVAFRPYKGGSLGTTNRRTRQITVYVKPSQSEQSLRVTLAHELAHALDFEHGTAQRRSEYRRLRGLPSTGRWFPCSGCDDLGSPAGDYAEVFALWLAGPGDFRSRLKPAPAARELAALVPLFQLPHAAASPSPSPGDGRPAQDEPDEEEGAVPVVLPPPPTPRAR